MKRFISVLLVLCLISIPAISFAANWVYVASNDDYDAYIDKDSIEKTEQGVKTDKTVAFSVMGIMKVIDGKFAIEKTYWRYYALLSADRQIDILSASSYNDKNERVQYFHKNANACPEFEPPTDFQNKLIDFALSASDNSPH